MAYEFSGDRWGKDFGVLKKEGIPLYQTGRALRVKVRDSAGRWFVPEDVMDAMPGARPARQATAGKKKSAAKKKSTKKTAAARQPRRRPMTTSIAPSYLPRRG